MRNSSRIPISVVAIGNSNSSSSGGGGNNTYVCTCINTYIYFKSMSML